MFKLIALTVLLALSGANAFWSACSDLPNALAPRTVESASCSPTLCTVTRGETLIADAYMTFNQAHSRLDVSVTAYIFGIGVNLPQDPPHDNACNSLLNAATGAHHGCPTTPGTEKIWRINMLVPTTYPSFSNTRVRFQLLENNAVIGCTDVQATLQ
ncbi:hypothetical protein PVAND_003432 [Polypedilum vanderplanki]|uniref:MD-2-related lipid-recognition domain-containing protein n=1 Tax=Polypedilum vanderplanki TaxID=319348 RepID=A0A9J6BUI3_POLVA|nr:hypothetical protein PVAND_003432 [Polypedilum vanderplanki]